MWSQDLDADGVPRSGRLGAITKALVRGVKAQVEPNRTTSLNDLFQLATTQAYDIGVPLELVDLWSHEQQTEYRHHRDQGFVALVQAHLPQASQKGLTTLADDMWTCMGYARSKVLRRVLVEKGNAPSVSLKELGTAMRVKFTELGTQLDLAQDLLMELKIQKKLAGEGLTQHCTRRGGWGRANAADSVSFYLVTFAPGLPTSPAQKARDRVCRHGDRLARFDRRVEEAAPGASAHDCGLTSAPPAEQGSVLARASGGPGSARPPGGPAPPQPGSSHCVRQRAGVSRRGLEPRRAA